MPHDIKAVNFTGSLSIQAAAADSKKPATFSMEVYTGVALKQYHLEYPVVVDLEGVSLEAQTVPARYHHNALEGVGHTTKMEIRDGSLWVEGVISRDTEAAREVLASALKGFPWQSSIGQSIQRMEFVEAGTTVEVNGKSFHGPLYVARESSTNEVSFVDLGADKNSSAAIAAAAQNQIGVKTMADPAPAPAPSPAPAPVIPIEAAAVPAPVLPVPTPARQNVDDVINAAKRESDRQNSITASAESVLAENPHASYEVGQLVEAAMIAKDFSAERFALEAHRMANTNNGFGKPRRSSPAQDSSMIEASLCIAGGMPEADAIKQFGEDTLQAADSRFRGTIGLVESIGIAAAANGFDGRQTGSNLEDMMRYAFPVGIQAAAGQSTISLPGIMSNVANKFLRSGFDSVEDGWRKIAAVRSVKDFKEITSHSLTGDMTYAEVSPGGELKHGSLSEETYGNKAKTFGRVMGVTRNDLVNDDLNALTTVFRMLGRGGAVKFNAVFWAEFMDNALFFAAGNKNLATGASSALSIDGYTKAEKMFFDQKDPNGLPLGSTPSVMVVPNGLSADADNLMASADVHGSSGKTPTRNPHRGKASVVRSSYLNQTGVTGASDVAWYLLANPLDLPVIEACFLNGVQRPTVERAQANFNTLGIEMRGYFDFGVRKQEFRGGVKMKGEA